MTQTGYNNSRSLIECLDEIDLPVHKQRKCAVCGIPLERFLFRKRLQKSTLYCSWKCFRYKPPAIIQLERAFGKDIKEVLIETARNYDTLEKQEQALGKSSQWLYSCIKKYFGMTLADFMAIYAIGARQGRYKECKEPSKKKKKKLKVPDTQ